MGCGTWTSSSYTSYSTSKGRSVTARGTLDDSYKAQDLFVSRHLNKALDPHGVIRECCDNEEHPNTVPVILALDVTGSMGPAAAEVAKKLNEIMTSLYEKVTDVEFCIMGIGDLAYDNAPLQVSQFESDVRIAEHLDKVWFEGGGGGNGYESYTAAWYFGLNQCKLDCWKRGKKGIIITLGDEPLNPYLPKESLGDVTGHKEQGDIETKDLYSAVSEKYAIYHLAVNDSHTSYKWYESRIANSWGEYLDKNHLLTVSLDTLAQTITDIIVKEAQNDSPANHTSDNRVGRNGIRW